MHYQLSASLLGTNIRWVGGGGVEEIAQKSEI